MTERGSPRWRSAKRHRTHQRSHSGVGRSEPRRPALHCAGLAYAEVAFIERFNGRLRDELLNETLFTSLAQTRVALGGVDYDDARPHSRIGWNTRLSSPSPATRARDRTSALRKVRSSSLPWPNRQIQRLE